MRRAECLTALTSKARLHKVIVYDLESKDGPSQKPGFTRVFLAGIYDGKRFVSFRNEQEQGRFPWSEHWSTDAIADGGCIDQSMRYLLRREYRGHYIYAHNGGNFDHLHILPWLTAHIAEFSYVIIPVQSSIQVIKVTCRASKKSFTFLDSFKLMPMSLAKAAKTFGAPLKMDQSLDVHEDDPSWETYLERDCVSLYACVTKYQTLLSQKLGGEMGITAPSTAMKLFRRRYLGRGVSPAMVPQHRHHKHCPGFEPTSPKEACYGCQHAWIRRSYYGGRTEVFRAEPYTHTGDDGSRRTVFGGKAASYYDINSSYARAMLEPMPAGEMKQYGPKKKRADFERLERVAVGFVECEVTIPRSCYLPPLPYRHPTLGKLVFPTGTFSGVWAWSELKLLFDPRVGGRINHIVRSTWYGKKEMFFDYVKDLYGYRDKSDPRYEEGLAALTKLLLVSLYGKFGMQEDRREIHVLGKSETAPEGSRLACFEDGDANRASKVCYLDKRVAASYIIPQISSEITALARVRLWRFMAHVLDLGGRLYYCDTDSLLSDVDNLPCSPDLGELKNEFPGETIDVELVGPKMYLLRKDTPFKDEHTPDCLARKDTTCPGCGKIKVTMKGIPKAMRTEAVLRKLQAGETIEFHRLEKIGAMVTKGLVTPPAMQRVTKRHVASYDKREMIEGGDTRALHMSDVRPTAGGGFASPACPLPSHQRLFNGV